MEEPSVQSPQSPSYTTSFLSPTAPTTPGSTHPLLSPGSFPDDNGGDGSYTNARKPGIPRKLPGKWYKKMFRPSDSIYSWWYSKLTLRVWWSELLCCSIAVVSLVCLGVTMLKYDGQMLHQWPLPVSINVLVAICSTVLSGSAAFVISAGLSHFKWTALKNNIPLEHFSVYDAASRGSLGSLKLLKRMLRIKHVVPILGALLTVSLVIMNPFIQYMVDFVDCSETLGNETATIPRAQVYNAAPLTGDNDLVAASLRSELRSAFVGGLFPGTIFPVSWVCPSGNCTFEETSTIGYCSTCIDVSNSMIRSKPDPKSRGGSNATWLDFIVPLSQVIQRGKDSTNFTLQYSTPSVSNTYGNNVTEFLTIAPGTYNIYELSSQQLPMIQILRVQPHDDRASVDEIEAQAMQCSFSPCARSFRSEIAGGQLIEETLSTSQGAGKAGDAMSVADLACLDNPTEQIQILRALGYDVDNSSRWLPYNVSIKIENEGSGVVNKSFQMQSSLFLEPKGPEDRKYYEKGDHEQWHLTKEALEVVPEQCIYQLSNDNLSELWGILFETFHGSVMKSSWAQKYNVTAFTGPSSVMAVYDAGSGNGTLEDVQALMQNISSSLTAYIRHHGNANFETETYGTVSQYTICIEVTWRYLAVLGLFVLLLVIYLASVLIGARRSQKHIVRSSLDSPNLHEPPTPHDFKDSPLPLLFHGLDYNSHYSISQVDRTNRMSSLQQLAEKLTVKLVPTDEGWKMTVADRDQKVNLKDGEKASEPIAGLGLSNV